MSEETQIPEGWIPFNEAIDFVKKNFMFVNSRFVLDNFDYKYTELRVDMRTGDVFIKPGDRQRERVLELMLSEARNQIEYLQEKFQETGSGNAVISRINSLISS